MMKALTAVFGVGLAGIVASLVMTIVTGVQQHRAASQPVQTTLPVPATTQ